MRISITSSGIDPDDNLVRFELLTENDAFKGTTAFYQYADAFIPFCSALKDFPFQSKKTVNFSADNINLAIALADAAGRIDMVFNVKDEAGNSVKFSHTTVEVTALHRLADKLSKANFAVTSTVEWQS